LVWGVWCAVAADEDSGFPGGSGLEGAGVASFDVEGGGEDAGSACKEGKDESGFESELHFELWMGKYWESCGGDYCVRMGRFARLRNGV
jgi:hypothetical protein